MSPQCPCCSGNTYHLCCEPFLSLQAIAPTPEKLMRSRYTAYVRHDMHYLTRTWHSRCQPENFTQALQQSFHRTEWLDLQVIEQRDNPPDEGFVTFIARFRENDRISFIYERSRFLREGDRWYYIDGQFPETGRNSRCPCQSGKKFKQCCGK